MTAPASSGAPARPTYLVITPPPAARSSFSAKDELRRPVTSWQSLSSSISYPPSSSSSSSLPNAPMLAPHSLAAYAQRVWQLLDASSGRDSRQHQQQDAIAWVTPLDAQATLRRTAVGGFALQQLLVCAVVGVGTFYGPVHDAIEDVAAPWSLGVVAAVQVAVVLALWFVDDPWPLLVAFSLLHSLLVAGVGVLLDSTLPFLNYFYACWGLCALTPLLSTRARACCASSLATRDASGPADGFLRWQLAAAGAFAGIAVPATLVVLLSWRTVFNVSWGALAASMALQLVLMGWFAWHASAIMLRALGRDEAVYGVVHLNVDAVAACLAGAVTAVAALLERCCRRDPSSEDEGESDYDRPRRVYQL